MSSDLPSASVVEVTHLEESTLHRIDEMLVRQREALLESSRVVVVDAVNRLVGPGDQPLSEQLRTALVQTLAEVQKDHLEPFLAQVRQTILTTLDEAARNHAQPLLVQVQESLLGVASHLYQTYTATLLGQVQETLTTSLNQVCEQYVQPVKELTQSLHQQFTTAIREQGETLIGSARQTLEDYLPGHLRWMGKRGMDYAIAGTLFCVAAILIALGLVEALRAMGVPLWGVYLPVGLLALVIGLIFYRRRIKARATTGKWF